MITRRGFNQNVLKDALNYVSEKYILILTVQKYPFIYTFLKQRYNIVIWNEG